MLYIAAAEMADLREAVKELRGALDALAANADLAQDKILKTNLRDARASAALRVQQLSTSTTSSLVCSCATHPLHSSNNPLCISVRAFVTTASALRLVSLPIRMHSDTRSPRAPLPDHVSEKLMRVSPLQDTSIQAAITEANALLTEVEGIRL